MGVHMFEIQPFSTGWTSMLGGGCFAFAILLIFYAAGLMGAGDVKFGGALGLWVGLQPLLPIWIGASLLAALHALLWLALRRWPVFPRLALALSGPAHHDDGVRRKPRPIPYAAYLALATVAWMVWRQPG